MDIPNTTPFAELNEYGRIPKPFMDWCSTQAKQSRKLIYIFKFSNRSYCTYNKKLAYYYLRGSK